MTFKALDSKSRDMLNDAVKNFSGKQNSESVIELLTELALDFGVPTRTMLELCIVEILFAFEKGADDIQVKTILDKTFNEGKEKVRAFMFDINGHTTKLFASIELNTIMNKDDFPNYGAALVDLQKKFHKSEVKDIILRKDKSKNDAVDSNKRVPEGSDA